MVKSSSLKLITLLTAPPRNDPGFLFSGTTGATTIVQLPLAFVRSGYVYTNSGAVGSVGYVGNNGYSWSRTSRSSTSAYRLNFNATDVYPSGNGNRWYGFPLRCL